MITSLKKGLLTLLFALQIVPAWAGTQSGKISIRAPHPTVRSEGPGGLIGSGSGGDLPAGSPPTRSSSRL